MNGSALKIGLVDDHRVLRDGLRLIIEEAEPPMEVTLLASSAHEALEKLETTEVQVLLTDIAMHGMDGLELARTVVHRRPEVRVIVLSMHDDAELVERAVHAGVRGYLLKDHAAREVVQAIVAVSRGEHWFRTGIPETVVNEFRFGSGTRSTGSTELTPRQVEVLRLICDGMTEREIADELGISHHTVHVHKNNIMQSLQLHSKVDLVKYAVQHKLVQM